MTSLQSLGPKASELLAIKIIGADMYEIDGRRVRLRWKDQDRREVLVVEEDVLDPHERETSLHDYLKQATSVAESLRGSFSSSFSTLPLTMQLSFANEGPASVENVAEDDRVHCMNLACEQARVRAQQR